MTVGDKIRAEIKKVETEHKRLMILLTTDPGVKENATRKCIRCNTNNSHYYAKTHSFTCSYC